MNPADSSSPEQIPPKSPGKAVKYAVRIGVVTVLAGIGLYFVDGGLLPQKTALENFTPEIAPELTAESGKTPVLDWKNLRELDLKTGKPSAKLKSHDGKTVKIAGFMVPLEDNSESVIEFLLVPYPQACIHVPAPPPNQIVHVKMAGGKRANMVWWEPIWATGTLRIVRTPNIYTESSYQLSGIKVEAYQDDYDAPY
jgi:hypothetical protein